MEQFGRNQAAPDGLDWYCLSCRREYKRAYRLQARVRDHEQQYALEYRSRPEVQDRQREFSKAYQENLSEEQKEAARERARLWREANPERYRLQMQQWRENNRLKHREDRRRYKARLVGKVDYEKILERDGLWCYLCESEVEPGDIHFDHVVPLSKGGGHSMDNIKVTHSRCNLSKNNRSVDEHLARMAA